EVNLEADRIRAERESEQPPDNAAADPPTLSQILMGLTSKPDSETAISGVQEITVGPLTSLLTNPPLDALHDLAAGHHQSMIIRVAYVALRHVARPDAPPRPPRYDRPDRLVRISYDLEEGGALSAWPRPPPFSGGVCEIHILQPLWRPFEIEGGVL